MQTTIATIMEKVIRDEPFSVDEGILHHKEGVDLMPANIELSAMEMSLVNAMSREFTLRTYVNEVKKNYDTVLIDCMPSLGKQIEHGGPKGTSGENAQPTCRLSGLNL